MKIWTKVKLQEKNIDINIISNSLFKYIKKDSLLDDFFIKYKISPDDKKSIENNMANRIAGLLVLYFSKDTKRINDIINKYNSSSKYDIIPELEGYVEK